jgi:UDP-3-O-[3-hydroxymyristoyl] glucosamine N-acyltransferase
MADSRFFYNSGAITLQKVATLTGATVSGKDTSRSFTDVAPLDTAQASDISFLDNVKYLDAFAKSKAGACFVRSKFVARAPEGMTLLVTEAPYYCYALTAQAFYPDAAIAPGTSPHAHIAQTAEIDVSARIDAGAVIGEKAKIGKRCHIGAHTVIHDGVEIGDDTRIGSHCSISHAIIGQRAMLHRGIHIGQDGFGFAPSAKGLTKVPQLGRVLIGNDVEIGSGTCIDRGAGPDTVIGDGTKIDNLVQIGHNVQIGRHAVIVAQVGVAGSSRIGDGAMLGGQAGIAGHVAVGGGAKVAAQSGITGDIPAGATYGGSPAVPVRDWHRQNIAVANLIKKSEK